LEESKAYLAESIYFESLRDNSKITYVLVLVNQGLAVLLELRINETSLVELVNEIESVKPLKLH